MLISTKIKCIKRDKMGGKSSRQYQTPSLHEEAARNFHKRIKAYNYAYHGPYHNYIEWCRAQYELECIPIYLRQGPNYRPQYDHWGNQEY